MITRDTKQKWLSAKTQTQYSIYFEVFFYKQLFDMLMESQSRRLSVCVSALLISKLLFSITPQTLELSEPAVVSQCFTDGI